MKSDICKDFKVILWSLINPSMFISCFFIGIYIGCYEFAPLGIARHELSKELFYILFGSVLFAIPFALVAYFVAKLSEKYIRTNNKRDKCSNSGNRKRFFSVSSKDDVS